MEKGFSEWWHHPSGPEDRHLVRARELLDSFDVWLTERLSVARTRRQNLAFFDTDLRRDPEGHWNGWAHLYFDPDDPPVLGRQWTVYRLFPASDQISPAVYDQVPAGRQAAQS